MFDNPWEWKLKEHDDYHRSTNQYIKKDIFKNRWEWELKEYADYHESTNQHLKQYVRQLLGMYFQSLRIQSECKEIQTRITPNTDTFYAV